MEFRDYPLLNTPSLTSVVLRSAAEGSATVDDFTERLTGFLRAAGEQPPVADAEIRAHLAALAEDLTGARLLEADGGRYALTPRGRAALEANPQGFARQDMMQFPEFAEGVRQRSREAEGDDDPRRPAYDAGFTARSSGAALEDNPFRPDSVDHLAWENGWYEARDQLEGKDRV